MQKSKIIIISISSVVVIFILIVYGLKFYFTYMESTIPEESELQTYKYMSPFLQGRINFRGIHHDLDTGYYSFAFLTSYKSPESFFNAVHENVTQAKWELVNSTSLERIYRRPGTGPWDNFFDKVRLLYDTDKSEVTFISEAEYIKDR